VEESWGTTIAGAVVFALLIWSALVLVSGL
jgi:hypothetical protein